MKHPLLNPKSTHYDKGSKPTIQIIEEKMTLIECIGFARGNIIKYQERIGHKGQKESDQEKIVTYENYLNLLKFIESRTNIDMQMSWTVSEVCKYLNIEIDYAI